MAATALPISTKLGTFPEIRIKLDYEQQCYRHSEMILRARLPQLREMLHDSSALEPGFEPDCEFKGSLSDPVATEQILTKLEYQLLCYRQAESLERARLRQLLQNSTTGRK